MPLWRLSARGLTGWTFEALPAVGCDRRMPDLGGGLITRSQFVDRLHGLLLGRCRRGLIDTRLGGPR